MKAVCILIFLLPAVFCAEKICGGTYRGFQYTITSPNYPRNYSNHLNCVYRLQGDTWDKCEQEFHLQFVDFNVKSSENCKNDYLQVGDRHIFCGKVVGLRKFTGVNNSLSVVFHSDDFSADKGFKIIVTAVPCILKFNHNHFYRGFTEEGRDDVLGNDIPTIVNNREINKDLNSNGNGSGTRFNLLTNNNNNKSSSSNEQNSSTENSQPNITSKSNPSIDTLPPSTPWSFLETVTSPNSPRISSYFFVPPLINDSNTNNDKSLDSITPPAKEFSLPVKNSLTSFSNVGSANAKNVFGLFDKTSSPSEQIRKTIAVPSRNYGEPGGLNVVNYDLQVANDCDNANNNGGSTIRNSYNSLQDQSSSLNVVTKVGSSSNVVYDASSGVVEPYNYQPPLQNYAYRYQGGYGNRVLPPIGNYASGINYPINYANSYNGYNINTALSNYATGGYNPNGGYNRLNYPGYSSFGYNSGYNPYNSIHTSTYNPSVSNFNAVYNSGYNTAITSNFIPSLGGNFYPNLGTNWGNGYYSQDRECCRTPTSRRFSIVSPGFPGGSYPSTNFGCRYTLTKSSPDICRLRLYFRYFNFGAEDQYCSYGYIEIDGRRYCGCKTGLSVTVFFADYIAKPVFVTYSGYPRSKFSGFVIDVVQESCGISGTYASYPYQSPYSSNPSYPYYRPNSNLPSYSSYFQKRNDELRPAIEKRNAQNLTDIKPSLPDPNPHIRAKRNLGYLYGKPSIPFSNGEIQSIVVRPQERLFGGTCQNRIFLDWAIASKDVILRNARCTGFGIPSFNRAYLPPRISRSIKSESSECEEINVDQGEITSPLYPNNYPANLNLCFRFKKSSNFCKVEVKVEDFEVEESEGCSKDYLSIGGENTRHCGNTLKNYKTIFDLTQVNSKDVYFVTDSYGTEKGFNISFSQLPCAGVSSNF